MQANVVLFQIKRMQQMVLQMQSQLPSAKQQQQPTSARHANGPL